MLVMLSFFAAGYFFVHAKVFFQNMMVRSEFLK